MASGLWRAGGGAFVLALGLRLLNLPLAFDHGRPVMAPADELYHWKRMAYSAAHFPQVLERDSDRGIDGAFCPWPPLYDLFGGAVARAFGIDAVVWIPPIVGAMAVALASMWIAAQFGMFAAITAAIALAASPFVVTQSWVGAIDHHFLEWALVFAIVSRLKPADRPAEAGGPLGTPDLSGRSAGFSRLALAMTAALFVQTALIIACGLAFIVFFVRGQRRVSAAFFASAAVIALYRLTRSPGYPNSAWFLGWPHAILLIAAGVALLIRPRWLGLICGGAIAVTAPVMQGLRFFGGDAWLRTIIEFQPMWRSHPADLLSQVVGLGAGVFLVWKLIPKQWPIALFAIVFLALTIENRRFWSISIPLLAIAGAIAASQLRWRWIAAGLVAIVPVVQLALWMQHPQRPIERYEMPWLQAADFMRSQPRGRVLAPWSMGHAFDVIGHQPVIIDGFGTMPDEATFWTATHALNADEATLARYCASAHVRYVVRPVDAPPLQSFREIYRTDPSFRLASIVIWEYRGHA